VEAGQVELQRLAEGRPMLAELAGQLGDCLRAIYAEPVEAALPPLSGEMAAEKRSASIPLLRGEALDVDWPALRRALLGAVGTLTQRRADAAPAIAEAIQSQKLDLAELTSAVVAGQPQRIHERADELHLDVSLTASVLSLTLFPVLVSIRTELESLLPAGGWEEGYCPVCGSFAKLGEFRGLEQTRFLRCGQCAAEWTFPRLRCPGCGNPDHRQLGYLSVEGEEGKWRVSTCEACRQYVKMISTLTPLSPLQLLVMDVATIHLDLLAVDNGFTPPL
jgi:FdhE protein